MPAEGCPEDGCGGSQQTPFRRWGRSVAKLGMQESASCILKLGKGIRAQATILNK